MLYPVVRLCVQTSGPNVFVPRILARFSIVKVPWAPLSILPRLHVTCPPEAEQLPCEELTLQSVSPDGMPSTRLVLVDDAGPPFDTVTLYSNGVPAPAVDGALLDTDRFAGVSSYAPMSHDLPWGRGARRASVEGQPVSVPASIAGLPRS